MHLMIRRNIFCLFTVICSHTHLEKDPGWLLASVATEAYGIKRVNEKIYFYFHLNQFL